MFTADGIGIGDWKRLTWQDLAEKPLLEGRPIGRRHGRCDEGTAPDHGRWPHDLDRLGVEVGCDDPLGAPQRYAAAQRGVNPRGGEIGN